MPADILLVAGKAAEHAQRAGVGIDDPGAGPTTAQTGTGNVPSNAELPEERGMESIRLHAAGTGPRAEWAKAYLEAQEKMPR